MKIRDVPVDIYGGGGYGFSLRGEIIFPTRQGGGGGEFFFTRQGGGDFFPKNPRDICFQKFVLMDEGV